MQPDGSTLRKYHLYLIDDNGTATGILIDEILLGPDYTSANGLTWLYAPDISAQTAHGTISLGRKLVLDLYYLIDPRNVATIGYQVINLPSGTNNQYGNGDYGATEPTFELIAGGTHNVPNGSTAQTPPGYVFLGWYAHLSDIAGGVAPLSTDLTFIPPVPAAGWVVGDTYTYYAIFRELEDIEISYDFTPSNGGSVSIDHDSFAPVTGKPKAVYTTPNPGFRFSHWTNKDGLWIAADGTPIEGSDTWTEVPQGVSLMGSTFFPQHVNGSYLIYNGQTFTAHFTTDMVSFTVERYKVINGRVVYINSDGTLNFSSKAPVEKLTFMAMPDSHVAVLYDPDNDRYYVAGVDATGQKLADALEYFFTEWAGYTYLPGYELAIESGVVNADGTLVLRMYYAADPNTLVTVERWTVTIPNANEPNNKVTDLYDTTYYGGNYNNNGFFTDTWLTLQVMANAGQTIPEGYLGVLAPLGYHYIDHPNEILSGIVLGDGSLLLRIYFEATEGATSYTVEHYIIDGKKNVTLLNSEVIDGVTAGQVVMTDPSLFDPGAHGHPGYSYVDSAEGLVGGVLMTLYSKTTELYVAGDGPTKLIVYYLADTRYLQFDLGVEGKWAEDFRDEKVRPMKAGNETILPGSDCAVREGYELVGWYITDRGTNTRGTNSVQVANDILANAKTGLYALGGLFVMPELANDSEFLTQIGDNYFYTLHAIWRATDATYSVEVWVQNADGTLQRVEVKLPGADANGVLKSTFGDTIDFNDPTDPYRIWGANPEDRASLGEGFGITDPAGYTFVANFSCDPSTPISPNSFDKTLDVFNSVNSIVLDANGKTIYLFYRYIENGVHFTVNRYMVLSDNTRVEVDKNGNRLHRNAKGQILDASGNVVAEENYGDYLIYVEASAGQLAHAVLQQFLIDNGITYLPDANHVVNPADLVNYYIIMNNIPGFSYSQLLSELTCKAYVAGDNSTVLELFFAADPQAIDYQLGAGQWAMANLNRDDGLFGGTLTHVYPYDTITLPVASNVERNGYDLVGWATSEDIAKAMTDAILADPSIDLNTLFGDTFFAAGARWEVPGSTLIIDGYGVTRLYAVYRAANVNYNVYVYRVEAGQIIRDKAFERSEYTWTAKDSNGNDVTYKKYAYVDLDGNSLLTAPTDSMVGFVDDDVLSGFFMKIPYRAGYRLITDPNYTTAFGQMKLTGTVTADGRLTLILYYEAIPNGSEYQVEYWYWDPATNKPVKFDERVPGTTPTGPTASTVTIKGTAGYTANVNTAGATNAPGIFDTKFDAVTNDTNFTSLGWLWKDIEGFVAAPSGSWTCVTNGTITYIYGYKTDADGTYVLDADGNPIPLYRTLTLQQGMLFSSSYSGTIVGDPNNMLVLRLFYTPAPRNVTFVPEQGVWVSGTDTFSSSSSNTYTTGQTINVPQNTHLTRPGYELIGWTTNHDLVDTTITDAWINDPNRSLETLKTLLGDSFASVFFDLNYTVTADSDQFLYAMWAPAETTFLVEHYRVVAEVDQDGNIVKIHKIEDAPAVTTTQQGKSESAITADMINKITAALYNLYPNMKGYSYYEGFSQLWNGVQYDEISSIASLAPNGTTLFKLYYVSEYVPYTVEFWKVSGEGVASRVTDTNGNAVSIQHEGLAGAYAKADAEKEADGITWKGYTFVDADGNTIIPAFLTDDAYTSLLIPNGYVYTPGTFTINDFSYTSDPYKLINGDGSTIIRLYFAPDTHKLSLILNGTATDASWVKSYAGAGNAFVQTGSINVVTGSVVYLPGAAAATRPGYQLVGWYETNDYIDYVGNDSITLYNNVLKTDPKFHAVGSLFTVPAPTDPNNPETFLYAVWVAQESNFQIEYYKVVGGRQTLAYTSRLNSLRYATGDTVDLRTADKSDLQAIYKLITNSTFSDGGREYDFRGYHFSMDSALGYDQFLRLVIKGDPTDPTIFKVYYVADLTTEYKVHHWFVDGDGNAYEALVEVRQGETDTEIQPSDIGLKYQNNPDVAIRGMVKNGEIYWLYDGQPENLHYSFNGFIFFPNSDGTVPGTSYQTSLAQHIKGAPLGAGGTEFFLYYLADELPLKFLLGVEGTSDYDKRAWTSGAADISGNYRVGKTIRTPNSSSAIRPGYELMGWYSGPNDTVFTNMVGYNSHTWAQWLAANGTTADGSGVYIPAGASFKMPQRGMTFYAIWRAKDVVFTVDRWQIEGGTTATKYDTIRLHGYAGDTVSFVDPTNPTATTPIYVIQADGTLAIDHDETRAMNTWSIPGITGYHLFGSEADDDPADATVGGVNYADLVVTEGVIAEIQGQATGEPKIVLVYVPNKNTEYKVYHHLVKGDGVTISDVVDENGNPYVVTYTGKTGAFVDEATGRSYALVYDPNNPVAPGLYIKGYVFGTHTGEKLSGTILADGTMRLDLYYLAERQQLNFELGTKANDGTYNNGAWWRGANPSTNIYKTGELVTLPNAMTGIRPGYTLYGWYVVPADKVATNGLATTIADILYNGCDLNGNAASQWIAANAGRIFLAGSNNFEMPNEETTLYAIWMPAQSEYKVIVNVLQGNGVTEKLAEYTRTGTTGNYLNYVNPLAPYEANPDNHASIVQWLQAIAIAAGYEIDLNPANPLGPADGILNAFGPDATAAGIDQTILYIYLKAIPNGTTFYVERYTVDVNNAGLYQQPKLYDTHEYTGTAGSYVRVDAALDTNGIDILNAVLDAYNNWIATAAAGAEEGWQYLHANGSIFGFSYDANFSKYLAEGDPAALLYATLSNGRIVGHFGDATSHPDALVLKLFYVVDQYTITYKSLGGQITDGATTAENVDRTAYYNHTFTPLPASQVTKTGYELVGWLNTTTGDTYNIKADGTFDAITYTWNQNITLEAIWKALPAKVTVVHVKLDHEGNYVDKKEDTFMKDSGLTFTVAERDNTTAHDAETYVDRYGRLNPNLSADPLFWRGYTHLKTGPFLTNRVLPGGLTVNSSIDATGYERAVVLADGSTVIYVFYYAGFVPEDPTDPNKPDPTDPHDPYDPDKPDPDPFDPDDPNPVNPPKPGPVDPDDPDIPTPTPDPDEPDPNDPYYPDPNPTPNPDPTEPEIDYSVKVNYVVNRYVVTGDGKRVLVSSHYYKSYVGNTIYADALYSGQTPGTTGTTEWHAFDKDIVGYTYRDSLLGPAAYWATAHPDWVTTDSGVIASVAGNGYGLVLNLYYEANTYRLTLNLDPDTAKGSFTVPAGWTLSADGRSIYRDYLTGQTVDPLPSDLMGTNNQHNNTAANPYRQGYELVGWSTQNTGALYGAGHVGQQAHEIAQKYFDDAALTTPAWLVANGTAGYDVLTAALAADGIYSTILWSADGATFIMPGTNLQLWAIWNPDNNTEYTVNRYKIDGQGNKVLVSTEKFTGYTDQLITADRNYYEKRLGNTVDDTDASHTYRYHDTAMNGYTYERIITQTITVTLADGSTRTFTVPGIPAAGLASIYELRLASDGSSVFDLYYAPYMLDEHGNPVLNKLTYATELPAGTTPTTGYGAWTGNPNAGTYTNRVEYFFTEQNTGKLFDDIARAGYDFLGWSTDDDAAFSKGSYNRSTATLISKLPGWDTTEGAYVTAWLAGTDLTNAKARLFTKIDANGYGFIMPGTDVVIYAVWFARDDTEYTVNHYRVDGNGNVKDVITETITGITDEPVTAIDRIGDQDIKDAYDAASKAYNWDDEFKGYEIVLDGTTITFKDATGATVTKQNIRTGSIFGDGSLVLELYYKALPFTLTFDGGKDKGAWSVIDSSIDPNDHSKKYVTPVYAEQSFDIGANYSGAHITRPGYTLIGWTTQKEWTLTAADGSTRTLEVATAMGLDSRAIMQAIMLANAGYAPNDPNRIFYQVGDTFVMGNGDTTLYAVWSARTYDLYLNPGTTTSIDNNVWQNHVSLVTDEEYKLPGSSVLKRDGYELVGWYYKQSVTVSGQANPVYVGTSEGRLSQLAAAVAQLDTGWSYTEGAHFTLNDPNTMYSMPAPEPMGFLWLYAVWRASSDTEFTLHYYKVDGNGNLQIWQELKGKGIAGESYKIANPYDATEVANAQYYKMDGSAFSFSSVDWRGYKYMGLADGFTLFNGNQNGYNSDSTLTWNGITTFSIYGLQAMANWTAGVKGNIIATVAGDGSTVISVVMDTLPLNLILDPGIYGEWQPNGTIPSPYDSYADAANGNGVRADQNLPLPDGTEVKRPGYTLVGWYYYDTAVNLKGNASIAAANAAEADGSKVDGLWVFTAVGDLFTMPNHDVTLYAVWRANEDTEYEVIIYKIDGDGNRVVHNTITHKGVTDEEAWADATDTPKVSCRNDDRPHQHPIDKRRPYILGYEYVEPGTTVSYTDGSGNIVNVTTKARDYIMGHLDDGTHLVLELYFDAEEWDLTIDLGNPNETGAGHWTPDATETRPNAFPAAPGQNSHTHKYKSDQTIILPIDVRYGGVVTAGPDAQGRPYSLIGYAFDDGGTVNVLLPGDTTPTTMSTIDAIMMARSLNGLLNFAYRDALMASIDPNTGKGIFIKADDTGSIWTMGYENMTLYAIWGLSVQSLTFDPNGYADVNDPTVADSKHHVHVKPDGTIDDTTTTATPGGKWNPGPNPPAGFEDGTMHNISEVVPLPDFDSVKRPGYTFLGWSTKLGATAPDADLTYVDVDGDGIPDAPTNWVMPADPTILYAVWQANDIELVYDANYPGITPPDPTLGKIGCIVNVTLTEPKRDGYRLKGWAVKANATEIDYKPGDEYEMLDLIVDPITGDIINPNVLYAVWELAGVELQYWGNTADHPDPGDEQLLKTVYVQLGDDFDWTYDPNKDSDPSNDYISHKTIGWWDEWGFELFNQDWVDMMGGIQPTIQYIADLVGWDGISPIKVYSAIELRTIEVIYESTEYAQEHAFNDTRYVSWDASPFYPGLVWPGYTLDAQTDDWGDLLDDTMTCGEILMDLLGDPLAETMYIYITWNKMNYVTHVIFPNGYMQNVDQGFSEPISLLSGGQGFNYPGFDFVGFFTEPDGQGVQVTDSIRFADLVADDTVTSIDLYAYFVPSGTAATGESAQNSPVETANEAAQAVTSVLAAGVEPDTIMKPVKAAQASTSVAPAPKAASGTTAAQSMGVASFADTAPFFTAAASADLPSVDAAEYAYTVNYYKNAVDAANLLGEAVLGKALLGTEIPYELGKFLPVGYTVEDALIEGALTVGENEEENVLNVIYSPELFSFFVNFYKDCMAKDNLVTSVEYEAQPFGSVVDLLAEDMNKYCPKGYTALTEDTSFTVGATPAENVLNLVFKPLASVLPNDPTEPAEPIEPNTPAQPTTPSTPVQKPVQPSSPASSAAVKTAPAAPRAWVNPVIAVPEPSYSAEPEQVANSEIIPEDSRPLAANPFAKRAQSSSTGVIGGLFLLLAAAATAASFAFMRMRKQSIQASQGLKGSALTLEQARTQRLTRYAILAAAPALLFYALWVLFLI